MLALLAIAMSAHLLGALALPRDMALWFFTQAAGPIFMMNLLAVPLIGALLERENRRISRENRMAAAATCDPASGLLLPAAFLRDIADAYAARPFGTFAGFLEIAPLVGPMRSLFSSFGIAPDAFVDRQFLAQHLDHGSMACLQPDGRILVPLSGQEMEKSNQITHELRIALRSGAARPATHIPFGLSVANAPDPTSFLRIAEAVVAFDRPKWSGSSADEAKSILRPGEASRVRRSRLFNPDEHDVLFAKADFLIKRSHS
jgi:hypothetical protein